MGSFVVVSDSHLSERAPEAGANWAAAANYVAASQPDLVVYLGDLTLDAPSVPSELAAARALLDELAVPWAAVPGNHDVGDNPWPELPASRAVDGERLNRWRATIGPDWWAHELDGWFLVAVDAQLFGWGLPAEAHQWSWPTVRHRTGLTPRRAGVGAGPTPTLCFASINGRERRAVSQLSKESSTSSAAPRSG